MKRLLLLLLMVGPAYGQYQPKGQPVEGVPVIQSTQNKSVVITTGNTFQTILASTIGTNTHRSSLTIQNNNTSTDNCWIYIGSGSATEATAILLAPGVPYGRYWPFVPSDAIQATCASNSDTLYVDTQ